jgi:hypothetical protein
MSDQAKVCPNCHAPRIVGNTKTCVQCGETIAARNKKCPKCEAPQYANVPESKSKPTMATTKSNSSSGFLMLFLGLALGGFGMLFGYPYLLETESTVAVVIEPSFAKVTQKNGVYVFINSEPQKSVESLGHYKYQQGNKLLDILNTKGENMFDEANAVLNMLVFDRKLDAILEEVKQQYPQAECVVFSGRLDKCEVYKFKE